MTLFRCGYLVAQGPSYVDGLIGCGFRNTVIESICGCLGRVDLSRAQIDRLRSELRVHPSGADLADSIDVTERYATLDAVCWMARNSEDSVSGISQLLGASTESIIGKIFDRGPVDRDEALRIINRQLDDQERTFRLKSPRSRLNASQVVDDRLDSERRESSLDKLRRCIASQRARRRIRMSSGRPAAVCATKRRSPSA